MVYDPDSIKLAPFIEKGAIAAKSSLELCKSCDIIFACLPTSAVTETVLFGDAGISRDLKPGQIFVDMTSGDPAISRTRPLALPRPV